SRPSTISSTTRCWGSSMRPFCSGFLPWGLTHPIIFKEAFAMKKHFLICLLSVLCWASPAWAKVRVVATLPVFSALAGAVGGDQVEIETLARANQDPHFLQAKPAYVVDLNRADLLLHAGMELEVGWLPLAVVQ